MSDSVQPHRRQPTRLLCPWDSPGKNTGVGCHFLLQCMKLKSESEVSQSSLTLSDTKDCSLPGSSVHGIFQARVLEWGAIAFSIYMLLYIYIHIYAYIYIGFPGGTVVKNPPAKAGDARDMNSIPGSGRSPEEGNGNSSILAWETRWTEEPGSLQSMASQRVRHDRTHTHTHINMCKI